MIGKAFIPAYFVGDTLITEKRRLLKSENWPLAVSIPHEKADTAVIIVAGTIAGGTILGLGRVL